MFEKINLNQEDVEKTESNETESNETEQSETEKQEKESREGESERPTDKDFEIKIKSYTKTREYAEHQYRAVIYELQDLANGRGDQDIYDEHYKGWTNEDFKEVLRRLGEEEDESERPTGEDLKEALRRLGEEGDEKESREGESERPTDKDFEIKIKSYTKTREYAEHQYRAVIYELQDLANGRGDQDIYNEHYKGWTNEDFKEVLRRLGEEEDEE